jgi:LPPG:FO 2-phospho-L-lactate transferase
MLKGILSALAQDSANRDPDALVAIVNTGDDFVLHGLFISPDLDTVTYTLGGGSNPETGWGLAGDTFHAMEALERYNGETWFRLGDKDLATHLYRTARLAQGASLSEVTDEIVRSWHVPARILPMSNDRVPTLVTLTDDQEVGFQEYFVKLGHSVPVKRVRFAGSEAATPTPGVLDALEKAEGIVICPSNPVLSIQPILAIAPIRETLERRREHVVAISPIIAGQALRGPADKVLAELGHEPSALGVAKMYAPFVGTFVIDEMDRSQASLVERLSMRCVVTDTVMANPERARRLGTTVIQTLGY